MENPLTLIYINPSLSAKDLTYLSQLQGIVWDQRWGIDHFDTGREVWKFDFFVWLFNFHHPQSCRVWNTDLPALRITKNELISLEVTSDTSDIPSCYVARCQHNKSTFLINNSVISQISVRSITWVTLLQSGWESWWQSMWGMFKMWVFVFPFTNSANSSIVKDSIDHSLPQLLHTVNLNKIS